MSLQNQRKTGELVVSSKVIGHISEGLYRGPAGVFKELISNAFDANAKTVWISTGRPIFDVVSVSDDGDGMTLDKFVEIVSGGIGDSDKRIGTRRIINGRQMIGRLGIGILGISQISHEFSITSHERASETAFAAKIRMKDFRKEILDQKSRSDFGAENDGESEEQGFPVGGYEATVIDFDPRRTGLTITATETTEGFRRQLSEDDLVALPKDFRSFSRECRIKDRLATGSWYNRMIWQVASLAPIPYFDDDALTAEDTEMASLARDLTRFDFSVIVDGVKIYKPILLDGPAQVVPTERQGEGEGPFHFELALDETIWDAQLRVKGYLHATAGRALHPDDMRGALIRLRHVGIGEYDKSFLDYRYAEGPRFAWMTCDLFVEEGLEDALTVGRDGFDVGHPHYLALRQWLHGELRNRIFPTLYTSIKARRLNREVARLQSRDLAFRNSISAFAGTPIDIDVIEQRGAPRVVVDLENGTATINNAASWPRGKIQRESAQKLSIIFELVRQSDSGSETVDSFVRLASDFLAHR